MPLSTLNNFGLLFGTKGGHIRIDYFGNEMDGELSHFYFGENVTYEHANKIIRIMERQKKSVRIVPEGTQSYKPLARP